MSERRYSLILGLFGRPELERLATLHKRITQNLLFVGHVYPPSRMNPPRLSCLRSPFQELVSTMHDSAHNDGLIRYSASAMIFYGTMLTDLGLKCPRVPLE